MGQVIDDFAQQLVTSIMENPEHWKQKAAAQRRQNGKPEIRRPLRSGGHESQGAAGRSQVSGLEQVVRDNRNISNTFPSHPRNRGAMRNSPKMYLGKNNTDFQTGQNMPGGNYYFIDPRSRKRRQRGVLNQYELAAISPLNLEG